MSTFSPITLDSSVLLSYYSAQLSSAAASAAPASSSTSSGTSSGSSFGSATTNSTGQTPPWDATTQPTEQALVAKVLSTTDFIQQSSTPLVGGGSASAETQADNQNLFTLYNAISSLGTLAGIAQQPGLTSGEIAGYNAQFQTGLSQVELFINSTTFNNLTLQTQQPSSSVTGTASVPLPAFALTGSTLVSDADLNNPLPNVSPSDSFTVGITKGGTTTNVNIDLSQIPGPLTLDNIVTYTNQQLAADGFTTQFQQTMTSGTIENVQDASWGISINPGVGETVSLSSAQATPALYVSGTTGSTTGTPANSTTGQAAVPADNQGSITTLTNLSGTPQSLGTTTVAPSTGTTTVQSSVVDFARQCLCRRQRHRQFRQPAQSGVAGRLSVEIQFGRRSCLVAASGQHRNLDRLFAGTQSARRGRRGRFEHRASDHDFDCGRQYRQFRCILRRQRRSELGPADPDAEQQPGQRRYRRFAGQCLYRRLGERRDRLGPDQFGRHQCLSRRTQQFRTDRVREPIRPFWQ